MAKALFFVLAAMLIVAALANEEEYENTLEDLFLAEKRGMNMKKYKSCDNFGQTCWCSKRSNRIIFCNGAGDGGGI